MKHASRRHDPPPELRPASYRVYFKEAPPIYLLLIFVIYFSVWGFSHTSGLGNYISDVVMGVVALLLFFVLRFRFVVTVDHERLTSRGFLAPHSVRWDDITGVVAYGRTGLGLTPPVTYRFVGQPQSVTINFKLFSIDCHRVIFAEIARRNIVVRDTNGRKMHV